MGVKSGSQPAPGLYVSNIYYRYRTDSHQGRPTARRWRSIPTGKGSQTINAAVPLVYYVTPKKVARRQLRDDGGLPIADGRARGAGLRPLGEGAATG